MISGFVSNRGSVLHHLKSFWRIALGARTTNVISLVLRQLYGPVGAGICAGIAAAVGLSQLLRRELFGLSHLDPISYAGAIGFFLLVAGLAAFIPARRALRVNPVEVLQIGRAHV